MLILKCFCEEPLSLEPNAQEWCATSCGHMFHYLCLTQWRERASNCPTCRKPVLDRHVMRLYPATSEEPHDDDRELLETCLHSTHLQLEQMQACCELKDQHIAKLKLAADSDKHFRRVNQALKSILHTFHGDSLDKMFDDAAHFEEVLEARVAMMELEEEDGAPSSLRADTPAGAESQTKRNETKAPKATVPQSRSEQPALAHGALAPASAESPAGPDAADCPLHTVRSILARITELTSDVRTDHL